MNHQIGKLGAVVTGVAVLTFAVSMIIGSLFTSCLSSMFIALGFIPFVCGLSAVNPGQDRKAVGLTAIGFAAVYAVIILLVYFAEITTVRMNPSLSAETLSIISYGRMGSLFFNYDLLGYGLMGLSTFFIAFTLRPQDKGDKALRALLMIHGVFFVTCLIMPMLPVFTENMAGGDLMGTLILEFWCAYFIPICILGYRYFKKGAREAKAA